MLNGNMRGFITCSPIFLIPIFTLFSLSITGETLATKQSLADGETPFLAGGTFALGFLPNSSNRYVIRSPMFNCLQGFDPKSTENGSGGCMRTTPVDYRNGTDGFIKVSVALLPNTSSSTVRMGMSLDECRAMCLSNCSCTAYSTAGVGGSHGVCIIWATELVDLEVVLDGGEDLYVRLAAEDLGYIRVIRVESQESQPQINAAVGMLSFLCITYWYRKIKKMRRDTGSITDGNDIELPLFDLGTVAAATNNFSINNKLGEGGFGPVYKGKLGEGQEIAVKRLSKTSMQGSDEFKTEVMLIAKLQHRNLVRLLGCCIQEQERMLIYEYMPNKSLDAFLFDKAKGAILGWQRRYHIITGIARGLLYLHEDSRLRVIHRDLKASNILLDKEMNPKISDFGMARMFGGDETETKTRRVVGTYGYMAPEYAMDGIFSVKSDVFSFGVLVLEIITGQKNRGAYFSEPHLNLLGHVWSSWSEGKCLELVDASMGQSFSITELVRCVKVGLLCVQEFQGDRPTMSSVVLMLGSDTASLPDPKQPAFTVRRGISEVESSSNNQVPCTVNGVTTTMLVGR